MLLHPTNVRITGMHKSLLTAAVLAGALALSGVAMADTSASASGNGGNGSAVAVGLNGNSSSLNDNGSHNGHNQTTSTDNSNQNNDPTTTLTDNSNQNNNSHNGHNSTVTTSISLSNSPVSAQILTASVSDIHLHEVDGQATGDNTFTGAGSSGAEVAGIQTVSQNTGDQSATNTATGIAATASVSFGSSQ
jgi:hypothetical protein